MTKANEDVLMYRQCKMMVISINCILYLLSVYICVCKSYVIETEKQSKQLKGLFQKTIYLLVKNSKTINIMLIFVLKKGESSNRNISALILSKLSYKHCTDLLF